MTHVSTRAEKNPQKEALSTHPSAVQSRAGQCDPPDCAPPFRGEHILVRWTVALRGHHGRDFRRLALDSTAPGPLRRRCRSPTPWGASNNVLIVVPVYPPDMRYVFYHPGQAKAVLGNDCDCIVVHTTGSPKNKGMCVAPGCGADDESQLGPR